MRKRVAIIVGGGVALAAMALAQFGIPSIPGVPTVVYDPANNAQWETNVIKWGLQIEKMDQELQAWSYEMRAFENARRMGWRGFLPGFAHPSMGNVFGEIGYWDRVVIGTVSDIGAIQQNWKTTTIPLQPSPLIPNLGSNNRAWQELGNAELLDSLGQGAFAATTQALSNEPANDLAIQNLESDCLGDDNSLSSDMQTNCVAGAAVLQAKQSKLATSLAIADVQLRAAEAKDLRDKKAALVNDVSQEINLRATLPADASISSDAVNNTRVRF